MIEIRIDGIRKVLHGENVTREESWNGIGDMWNGYSALLTDCVGGSRLVLTMNTRPETHGVIDYVIMTALDEDEKLAICLHYGLMCYGKKRDLATTTTRLNSIYGRFNHRSYHEGEVNGLINSALSKLVDDADIKEYINSQTGGELFPTEEVAQ